MNTHTSVTIWLDSDAEATVQTAGRAAWANVGSDITIHSLVLGNVMDDLDVLGKFFQDGVEAVAAARQQHLLKGLTGG